MKYRRLNITLPEETLSRADAFAKSQRYSRSALIAEALEAFVSGAAGGAGAVRESGVVYAQEAVGLNPAIRPFVPGIIDACRKHGVVYAALVGSATQPDPAIVPRDLDLLVRFTPGWEGRADRYFGLIDDLSELTGRGIDLIEIDAMKNSRMIDEFTRTRVVLYETS